MYNFFSLGYTACHTHVSTSALLKGPAEGQDLTLNTLFIYITNCRNCSLISVFEMPRQTSKGIQCQCPLDSFSPWSSANF